MKIDLKELMGGAKFSFRYLKYSRCSARNRYSEINAGSGEIKPTGCVL